MTLTAYLGPPGTYTHKAALKYLPENMLNAMDSIPQITDALENGMIEQAILPLENSLEGTVSATFDYLLQTSKKITTEVIVNIEHVLATLKGKELGDIKVIASHPQALGQCSSFINKLNCFTLPTVSTVAAIKELNQEKPVAVIIPPLAARLYDLEILATGISDAEQNTTRFCLLSETQNQPTGNDKSSIIIEIADKPGSLYTILNIFAEANINLTKIESRPAKKRLGKYLFAIDFEGHIEDEKIQKLLGQVLNYSLFFKFLGSYTTIL